MQEKRHIVNYLVGRGAYSQIRGRAMWVNFANSPKTTRTWQSIKETFIERILPDIHNPYYNLTHEQITSFRACTDISKMSANRLEIGESSRSIIDGSRHDIQENPEGLVTALRCRTIKIGSYKYVPKDKVYLSSKGIKIVAPSLKDENKEVALQIQTKEVVKILVHYSKALPVIFLYTMDSCGAYIRKSLDMTDESGAGYFHPISKEDAYKRITLLPEMISEEVRNVLKNLFGEVLDKLSSQEANEILVKTCSLPAVRYGPHIAGLYPRACAVPDLSTITEDSSDTQGSKARPLLTPQGSVEGVQACSGSTQ